jgi:hypothetical protein
LKTPFKDILIEAGIVLILVLLLFHMVPRLFPSPQEPQVITKTETVYDTIKIEKIVYQPQWYDRIITNIDTIIETDTVFRDIDTLEVLKDYYAKYIYQDTIKLDTLGYLVILDTITENKIFSRETSSNILIPTTTITNTEILNEREFYAGISAAVVPTQLNSVGAEFLYRSKNYHAYGIGLGVNQNLEPILSARLYWRINK